MMDSATECRRVAVVVGNPSAGSRTLSVAEQVGRCLARHLGCDDPCDVVDLASLGPALLSWSNDDVDAALDVVRGARGLVVASPTYKASITGLTKLFLDRFGRDELAGIPTIAVMTGASRDHALAVEVHLRPVLVEIGASCPTRGLYISGEQIDDPSSAIAEWETASANVLARFHVD